MRRLPTIVTYLFWISIGLFILCVLLPQGTGLTAIFRTRKVFYVSMTLLIAKGFFSLREKEPFRFLEILPFLGLFLFSCFQFSRLQEYPFGVDDAFYYSYVSSVCIDGDLDLWNQYERAGLPQFLLPRNLESKTPIGRAMNIFPIGLSVLWTPFFLFGFLVAAIVGLPLDGFSRPFTFAVGVGNIAYVCAGLYFCFRFCANFVSRTLALIATFAVLFATPYLFLFFRNFQLLSEPVSFALVALLLFFVWHSENKFSYLRWFLLGLLFGILIMLRFHNFVFGIAPAAVLFVHALDEENRSRSLRLAALFSFGVLLGFLPQLIVWKLLWGQWFASLGGFFLPWLKSPFILETLFSSRKGLFPWAPITILCLAGLVLLIKKNRRWGYIAMAIFVVMIWLNSSQLDWWASTSLGARRFIPFVSVFVVGLALLYATGSKITKVFLIVSVTFLIFLNLYFVRSFSRGRLEYEHADRFSDILTGPYKIYQPVVYSFEFPVQFAYWWKYGTPLYGPYTDFFIGEDVFYFQSRVKDQISSEASPLFGKGWEVSDGIRKTSGSNAVLYIPMFVMNRPRFLIQMEFLPAGTEKDIWIDFYWNGKFLRSRKVFNDGRAMELAIHARDYVSQVNTMTLHVYHSRSEKENAPRIQLRSIHFERDVAVEEP